MKKRTIFILALLVLLLGSTVGAYAYWDNLQTIESETINLGAGTSLTVNADVVAPAGKVLVPVGFDSKPDDVTSIALTYQVKLDQTVTTDLNLTITASNIEINGDPTNAGLVTIDISPNTTTVNSTDVEITVIVSISEPATKAIYDAIKNQAITFDLTFTAE